MPACASSMLPVPTDMRVRSLLGSVCWSFAKARISGMGSGAEEGVGVDEGFWRRVSMEGPPGTMSTS